jgi:2-haloacid dehalogenase
VPFEETVVASEIASYKPAPGHWREFAARTGADPGRHVHVGASLFHDIAPATELGLPSVWINRLGERPGPQPSAELPDLTGLGETLDSLLP